MNNEVELLGFPRINIMLLTQLLFVLFFIEKFLKKLN